METKVEIKALTKESFTEGLKSVSLDAAKNCYAKIISRGGQALSKYVTSKEKISVSCHNGHVWGVRPSKIQQNRWCPTCPSDMAKEEFVNIVTSKGGKLLSQYTDVRTHVQIQCSGGHRWMVSPSNIKTGTWCQKCRSEKAKKKLIDIVSSMGGKLSGKYINSNTHVEIQCADGHIWWVLPSNIKARSWCSICSYESTKRKFLNVVSEKEGKLISVYINTETHVSIQCSNGHIWDATPHSIGRGSWCPMCAYSPSEISKQKFLDVVSEKGGKIISEYINTHTRVTLRCSKSHMWVVRPDSILSNSWCPSCKQSKGELLLEKCFKHFNQHLRVPYESQLNMPNTKYRYDYVASINGRHSFIEFDGEQHFNKDSYFNTLSEDTFTRTRSSDIIKSKYAVSVGQLIRLTYKVLQCDENQVMIYLWYALWSTSKVVYIDVDKDNKLTVTTKNPMYAFLDEHM